MCTFLTFLGCVSQVTLYHLLKLFQSDSSAMPKKTVVSEFYDEMVCLRDSSGQRKLCETEGCTWFLFSLHNLDLPGSHSHDAAATDHIQTTHTGSIQTRDRVYVHTLKTDTHRSMIDEWRSSFSVAFKIVWAVTLLVCSVGELEQKTKEKMEAAKKRTSLEITELKDKLKASRENINHLKAEIRKLEEDGDHKDHWKVDNTHDAITFFLKLVFFFPPKKQKTRLWGWIHILSVFLHQLFYF